MEADKDEEETQWIIPGVEAEAEAGNQEDASPPCSDQTSFSRTTMGTIYEDEMTVKEEAENRVRLQFQSGAMTDDYR